MSRETEVKLWKRIADILPCAMMVGIPAGLLILGGLRTDQTIAIGILAIAGNLGLLAIASAEKA